MYVFWVYLEQKGIKTTVILVVEDEKAALHFS